MYIRIYENTSILHCIYQNLEGRVKYSYTTKFICKFSSIFVYINEFVSTSRAHVIHLSIYFVDGVSHLQIVIFKLSTCHNNFPERLPMVPVLP